MKLALIVALLACAAAAAAQAAEPVPVESLAAPLLKAKTYCESGKFGARVMPAPMVEATYRVCASSDGRFKYVENPGKPEVLVIWSDGKSVHRFVEYGGGYQRYDLGAAYIPYDKPREKLPAMHSRLLRAAGSSGIGAD